MAYLLAGLAGLVLVLFVLRGFVAANPSTIARQLRFLGGSILMAVAAVIGLRGRIDLALLIGVTGWGLLMGRGVLPWGGGGWGGRTSPTSGSSSNVKTSHLEMELDLASGATRGTVLKGRFSGRAIDDLSPADLVLLWQDYAFADPDSAQIIEAYLDRRHPTWRDDLERQSGGEDSDRRSQNAARPQAMTRAEALEILGLAEGATEEEVRAAHRDLMKKLHPDRGGSNYLASKINEAKDVLTGG
ncbi:MAG: DnaJ domain-containing protein [Hyphomicrobium sp.]|jgi:hypothetical protein|nr:DnaJ domain-containing protein [Hyphomicrobium sp.]